jgi:hypothetical protein
MRGSPRPASKHGSYRGAGALGELLIDCEEDRMLRAVLVGMLREGRSARAIACECAGLNRATRRSS